MRISPDGEQALILNPAGESANYKNTRLHNSLIVWDMLENKEISLEPGIFRDLEGVQMQGDGSLLRADQQANGDKQQTEWWTFRDHFSGLQVKSDAQATFTPLAANFKDSPDCQFCATCTVDSGEGEINCSNGISDSENARLFINSVGGKFILSRQNDTGVTSLGEIALPELDDPARVRVRLLGYSMPQQTLFYCVDENYRQAGCFIFDPYTKEIIEAPGDISYLRFSPDGLKAAFIDRAVNALFLYDFSAKTLLRKSPFKARSYPVNRCFFR